MSGTETIAEINKTLDTFRNGYADVRTFNRWLTSAFREHIHSLVSLPGLPHGSTCHIRLYPPKAGKPGGFFYFQRYARDHLIDPAQILTVAEGIAVTYEGNNDVADYSHKRLLCHFDIDKFLTLQYFTLEMVARIWRENDQLNTGWYTKETDAWIGQILEKLKPGATIKDFKLLLGTGLLPTEKDLVAWLDLPPSQQLGGVGSASLDSVYDL